MLAVVFGHYWQFTPGEYWFSGKNNWLLHITNGITHFSFRTYSLMEFMLMMSGFQMYASYRRISSGEQSFGVYLKRKVLRLFPAITLSNLLMTCGLLLYQKLYQEDWYNVSLNGRFLVENLFNVQAWLNSSHTMNGPLWYVSVYFFCLILYYWLVRLGEKIKTGYWIMTIPVLVGIFASAKGYDYFLLNNDMARGYLGFFAGVLLAVLFEKLPPAKNRQRSWICGLSILIWIYIKWRKPEIIYTANNLDVVLFSMLFLYGPVLYLLVHHPRLEHFAGAPGLVWIGKISYCMYALNFPVYIWLRIFEYYFHISLPYTTCIMFWFLVLLQIIVAAACTYGIEKGFFKKLAKY